MEVGAPRRGEVYLVSLDPARGPEIRKTRPCVIVSPDDLNDHLGTFLIARMTTGGHPYPFRISCRFQDREGFVVADQLRTVDRGRLVRRLGTLSPAAMGETLDVLQRMFAA
ncbi:MAG: type II toxin-antitoxin system PemK/MazF family toxin [Gemmatimonadota bacterium]|nr:type II toxin-antitoxin system PemK/MazF family toxin [Gemmatimonadota bacterium]MDE2984458.1 type II toxin-antitoxin system PemK/MazF family toxin [Gemmatimonadota bacterium]